MKTSNDTERYWSEFEKTGSIASYMNYKSAMRCSSAQAQADHGSVQCRGDRQQIGAAVTYPTLETGR